MGKINTKISIFDAFLNFGIAYIVIFISMPFTRTIFGGGLDKICFFVITITTLLVMALSSKSWFGKYLKNCGIFLFLFSIIALFNVLLSREHNPTNILDIYILFSLLGIAMFLIETKNSKRNAWVINVFIICMIITAATSIYGLSDNSNYARMLVSSSTSREITESLRKANIGSYDFIYSSIMIAFLFLKNFKTVKRKRHGIIMFACAILDIICVIKANFTIAYLLLAIYLFLLLIPTQTNRLKFILFSGAISFIILIFGESIVLMVLQFIKDSTGSIMTQIKMQNLISIIQGQANIGAATERGVLMMNSIKSFVKSPILGVGLIYGDFAVVGGHSQILDDLARFGLLGYSLLIIPILKFYKWCILKINIDRLRREYFIILAYYIILSLINVSLPYYISLAVFLFIPVFIEEINKNEY